MQNLGIAIFGSAIKQLGFDTKYFWMLWDWYYRTEYGGFWNNHYEDVDYDFIPEPEEIEFISGR